MSKAAIYTRVSTGQQAEEGHSLANQKDACTKYAEDHGLQVVKIYEDAGVSGTTSDRPAMQRALKETDSFEHLVIYDSTRLGRELEVNSSLRAAFSGLGVQIHQVTEGGAFDPHTTAGVFMTAIMDARAKAENIDRSDKSRAGKYAAVKSGNVQVGNPPFGYDLIRQGMNARGKGGKSVLIINKTEAVGVRKAFKLFNEGKAIGEIARRLEKARIKKQNGKPWSRENVRDLLDRETYSGTWTYGKTQTAANGKARKSVSVKVPKIVDRKVYQKAQVRLKANARANAKHVKYDYLLRGRVLCSQCNRPYICRHQKYKKASHFYYQHRPKADHDTRNFKLDVLEERVKKYIQTALKDPETFVKLLGEHSDENEAVNKRELETNQKAQAKIREHRANSLQLLVEKTITKKDWLDLEAGYKDDLAPLEVEEQQLIEDQQSDPIELEGYEQMIHEQAQYLAEGGSEQDFQGKTDWAFYVEAMDLKIEVGPEAERISASALGIVNALLPFTDKKSAPANC
jgi:site-specific DNA recombinase